MKYGQVKSAKLQLNSEIHVIHSPRSPRQRTQHPCVRNLRRWLLSHRSHDPQSTAHGQIDQGSCCGSRDISSYLFWCVKISSHLFWFVYVGVCYLMLLDITCVSMNLFWFQAHRVRSYTNLSSEPLFCHCNCDFPALHCHCMRKSEYRRAAAVVSLFATCSLMTTSARHFRSLSAVF